MTVPDCWHFIPSAYTYFTMWNTNCKYGKQRLGTGQLSWQRMYCHFNKKCNLLSYSKIGEEQTTEDAEDGPPELLVGTLLFRFQCADMLCGSEMSSWCLSRHHCHCAAKTAAVHKSFHLSGFQSIALICCRLPLFSSECFPISCLNALRDNQNEIWLDFRAQPCVKGDHFEDVSWCCNNRNCYLKCCLSNCICVHKQWMGSSWTHAFLMPVVNF